MEDSARLHFIIWRYPKWKIGLERLMWTATRRPTPNSLHFMYARTLDELERRLRDAEGDLAVSMWGDVAGTSRKRRADLQEELTRIWEEQQRKDDHPDGGDGVVIPLVVPQQRETPE